MSSRSGKHHCVLQTLEKVKGIEVLKEACAACGEAIAARKGRMIVKDEARVVSLWLLFLNGEASAASTAHSSVASACMSLHAGRLASCSRPSPRRQLPLQEQILLRGRLQAYRAECMDASA